MSEEIWMYVIPRYGTFSPTPTHPQPQVSLLRQQQQVQILESFKTRAFSLPRGLTLAHIM